MAFGRTTRHPEFPDMPTARELTDDADCAFASGVRGASVLHGAAIRRAARYPGGSSQGAAGGVHGDVPGQGASSTRPRSSAST